MSVIDCNHSNTCRDYGKKCMECNNNRARNYVKTYFEKANDNLGNVGEQAEMIGNAEQGGYKCPICGHLTSPYSFGKIAKCEACGNILNIIGCI